MDGAQRPLELILARNLLSNLSTAALLVDEDGIIAFYNEAAGELLGRRFEEAGPMSAQDWGREHGPFDDDGEPIPFRTRATRPSATSRTTSRRWARTSTSSSPSGSRVTRSRGTLTS